MTIKKSNPASETAHVRKTKGSAQEAIGKLIGDDAEIRKGQAEQEGADLGAPAAQSTGQE